MKINSNYSEKESIVLRYGQNIEDIPYHHLQAASIKEGTLIVDLGDFYGVGISLLDLSSLSYTGTFKDWLASITIADCISRGINKYVYQSSGNTGMALAAYSAKHQLCSILFYPSNSRYKLSSDFIDEKFTKTVECDFPEPLIKQMTKKVSEGLDILQVPTLEHQIQANKLRAYFLEEHYRKTGRKFDWHVQSLSSGYGPFGFYEGIKEIKSDLKPPKLLGIQQEATHPYATDYREQERLPALTENIAQVIEPTLFRSHPSAEFLQRMRNIIKSYGGAINIISNNRYKMLENETRSILQKEGIILTTKVVAGQEVIVEKSGLLALMGTIEAIRAEIIKKGEKVLIVFTGGVRQQKINTFSPNLVISHTDNKTFETIKKFIL